MLILENLKPSELKANEKTLAHVGNHNHDNMPESDESFSDDDGERRALNKAVAA